MSDSIGTEFVLKHVFLEVTDIPDLVVNSGKKKEHQGFSWRISGVWTEEPYFFKISLECLNPAESWSTEVSITSKAIQKVMNMQENFSFSNNHTTHQLASIDIDNIGRMTKNSDMPIDLHIQINKINGKKPKCRDFSMEKFSDVALIVKNEKFHVSKLFLASHSTYFEALFMGNFEEAKKSEIEIKDVDPHDFQDFLDFIHLETDIEDDSIDGILRLADFFNAKVVLRRCEQFLIEKSEKSMKIKFQAAIKFNLKALRKKCISSMTSKQDVISAAPEDPAELDSSAWADLFHKLASF
uniref:BTB domain-containing protein n=1 Tax=Caenorhabditis tropicalis TaxID=1561998 RepID=A0A1I7UGM3_9PELO